MNNNYIKCNSNVKVYLRDIIIDLQESDAWKIQLTMVVNSISSKDTDGELVMQAKSDKRIFDFW